MAYLLPNGDNEMCFNNRIDHCSSYRPPSDHHALSLQVHAEGHYSIDLLHNASSRHAPVRACTTSTLRQTGGTLAAGELVGESLVDVSLASRLCKSTTSVTCCASPATSIEIESDVNWSHSQPGATNSDVKAVRYCRHQSRLQEKAGSDPCCTRAQVVGLRQGSSRSSWSPSFERRGSPSHE